MKPRGQRMWPGKRLLFKYHNVACQYSYVVSFVVAVAVADADVGATLHVAVAVADGGENDDHDVIVIHVTTLQECLYDTYTTYTCCV